MSDYEGLTNVDVPSNKAKSSTTTTTTTTTAASKKSAKKAASPKKKQHEEQPAKTTANKSIKSPASKVEATSTTTTAKKASPTKAANAQSNAQSNTHPKYIDMIIEAIRTLKERNGSSRQAILKYVQANFNIEDKLLPRKLNTAIKNAVEKGLLNQSKGTGANGSFKLGDSLKKPQAVAAKKQPKRVKKSVNDGESKPKKESQPSKKVSASAASSSQKKEPAKKKAAQKKDEKVVEEPTAVPAPVKPSKAAKKPVEAPKAKVVKKPVAKKTKPLKKVGDITMSKANKSIVQKQKRTTKVNTTLAATTKSNDDAPAAKRGAARK